MRLTKFLLSSLCVSSAIIPLSVAGSSQQTEKSIHYNGFSAGFNGGVIITNVNFPEQADKDKNEKIIAKHSPFDDNYNFTHAPVGFHIDYHKSNFKEGFYFGLGLSGGTILGSPSKTVLSGEGNLGYGFSLNGNVTLKQKRSFYAEITPRFGFKFNHNSICYALLSVRHSTLESTLSSTGEIRKGGNIYLAKNQYKDKSSRIGIAPGLGFDTKLGQHWSIGAEYKYFFEKSLKFANGIVKASLNTHNILAKVSYHF